MVFPTILSSSSHHHHHLVLDRRIPLLFAALLCCCCLPLIITTAAAATTTTSGDDDPHGSPPHGRLSRQPPNIILFMTDDQDVRHDSLKYMPNLNRLFRQSSITPGDTNTNIGTMEFVHYYVPTGLCCPSRTTILRGQYCHNTEIYDNADLNNATYKSGGWHKYVETGLETETFITRLQEAGYETALVGKYMNGYTDASHIPAGFNHWMGMISMVYYGPSFSNNGTYLQLNNTVYQTDFIVNWALDFLKRLRDPNKPFFLMITPYAPHTPATPAQRHKDLFNDMKFPRLPSFNPLNETYHKTTRPVWIKDLPLLTQQQVDDMDEFYRNRLRALQAVDEGLAKLVTTLQQLEIEDSTYIFYTSDNGQHFGDYRIPAGKRQAYETDVLVPLLVRGPNIGVGNHHSQHQINKQVIQSVDLGPTFLDLATTTTTTTTTASFMRNDNDSGDEQRQVPPALSTSYPMDGKSILPLLLQQRQQQHQQTTTTTSTAASTNSYNDFRWAALLEMYGGSSNIGPRYKNHPAYYHNHMFPNTYQAVRVINGPPPTSTTSTTRDDASSSPSLWDCLFANQNLLYVEWCTGERELYNMTNDPYQIHNLLASASANAANDANTLNYSSVLLLVHHLSKLLAKLGDCKGSECYDLVAYEEEEKEEDFLFESQQVQKVFTGKEEEVEQRRQLQHRSLLVQEEHSAITTNNKSHRRRRRPPSPRFPCFNPTNWTIRNCMNNDKMNLMSDNRSSSSIRRRPFAVNLPVPEPFQFGFPFSDGDIVSDELLASWENQYKHYFY